MRLAYLAFSEKGYEPAFGARPMRRLIQREIEDPIANMILSGEAQNGDTIIVEAKNQKSVVSVRKPDDKTMITKTVKK